jgi:type IV pilus assembly protein PilB
MGPFPIGFNLYDSIFNVICQYVGERVILCAYMADFDTEKEAATLAAAREREEEDVARLLADKYNLTYTDLSLVPIDTEALRTIPEETAKKIEAVAFAKAGNRLSIAVNNPNNPGLAPLLNDLGGRNFVVEQFLVSRKSIAKGLSRYADLTYTHQGRTGVFEISVDALAKIRSEITSIATLKTRLDAAMQEKSLERVPHVIETVFGAALALRASDIHFEPEETETRLRLRLDGLLTEIYRFDAATYHLLSSRVKLLSGVKLNVINRAQDGRFSISAGEKDIEIRASFIPEPYGESVVLRVLDPNAMNLSIDTLGINQKLLERLRKEIRRSNGMLLTTGPTGSGKTTTLYSFLQEIHTPDIKIITIEDPIEYRLAGIVQTQADQKNYTFAQGLRSIVRQDPDVIMVGEIRDGETANIAIEAALTGHFVLSTLHTNNAAGTFPRLVDLGADPKSFGSAISVSMAQRLIRTLDSERKKTRPTTPAEKKMIEKLFETVADKALIPTNIDTVYEAAPEGEHTGYKGRTGIHEAIFMDDELATLLRDNPAEHEIAKSAVRQGYLTMAQEGVLRALAGDTTLEEVGKAVDLPFE